MPEQIRNPKSEIRNPHVLMDRMYRYQRYFYDLTRKFYLLGRDRLITEIGIEPGENVLEIGCGTARNLILLARKHPDARFFGLDASAAMLQTARAKIDARGLDNIALANALAGDFAFDKTFALAEKFDAVFFSYAVSIIPPWRESLENALANLKPGKTLYIVDFFDQRDLPRWFRKMLQSWLRQFHVAYPEELLPFFRELEAQGAGEIKITPLYRRYALLAKFTKAM
ncbi:MAG: class I SAM-dependent methyltransferase [Acidobacteria bacterium]|nr:class I SAM-dependent methyltransferase [Acidobacteriota bacterium]